MLQISTLTRVFFLLFIISNSCARMFTSSIKVQAACVNGLRLHLKLLDLCTSLSIIIIKKRNEN